LIFVPGSYFYKPTEMKIVLPQRDAGAAAVISCWGSIRIIVLLQVVKLVIEHRQSFIGYPAGPLVTVDFDRDVSQALHPVLEGVYFNRGRRPNTVQDDRRGSYLAVLVYWTVSQQHVESNSSFVEPPVIFPNQVLENFIDVCPCSLISSRHVSLLLVIFCPLTD
jgi:hypothetical protein